MTHNKTQYNAYMRQWRANHPGYSSRYTTAWARKNRDKDRALKKKSARKDPIRFFRWQLWKKYHITLETYNEMLVRQGNKCGICERSFSSDLRSCVDHDHNTGKFRGILCNNCNSAIGFFAESITTLSSAIKYLNQSKEG
jgi:hypothetical protein